MNPLLASLQPYPFERLKQLFASVTPNSAYRPISLGIGEPRHATPQLVLDALAGATGELAMYPPTAGSPALRQACAGWVERRYGVSLDPATQILPVNGSREALFAFAQTVVDAARGNATVICPNPFYQIYEGAALLAGAKPYYAPSDPSRNFNINWDGIPRRGLGQHAAGVCLLARQSHRRRDAHGGLGKTFRAEPPVRVRDRQ